MSRDVPSSSIWEWNILLLLWISQSPLDHAIPGVVWQFSEVNHLNWKQFEASWVWSGHETGLFHPEYHV